MNFLSHHEIARIYRSDEQPLNRTFLFGSVITDLARMSGSRKGIRTAQDPDLLAGIEFHDRTNKPAFDQQPHMLILHESLRESFAAFLPPRTATQAANVSKDLLFDGIQLKDPESLDEFRTTLQAVLSGKVDLSGIQNPTLLLAIVKHLEQHGPPDYGDVEVVTTRLQTVLSRTRTPIEEGFLGEVAQVLSRHQPTIFMLGPLVMDQTVTTLREIFQDSSVR